MDLISTHGLRSAGSLGAVTGAACIALMGLLIAGCGGSSPSSKSKTAALPAALTSPLTLSRGASAVKHEASRDIRGIQDPNSYDVEVTAICKPPRTVHGPYGNPQLRCTAVLRARVLGLDSPIDPRHRIDSEPWVVDLRTSGKIIGPGPATKGFSISGFPHDLRLDADLGCFKAYIEDPSNVPSGCLS